MKEAKSMFIGLGFLSIFGFLVNIMENRMTFKTYDFGAGRVLWTDGSLGDLSQRQHAALSHPGSDKNKNGQEVHLLPSNPNDRSFDEGDEDKTRRERRSAVRAGEWRFVQQVHGAGVVISTEIPTEEVLEADALVTQIPEVTLSIKTADCGPLALFSEEGIVAAVHAGWKGIQEGVIASTAVLMRNLGATSITAALGPCIHPECYSFGEEELKPLVTLLGESIRGETSDGKTALDLPAAIEQGCKLSEVELIFVHDSCTACDTNYFSHRARKDVGRQAMLVWRE